MLDAKEDFSDNEDMGCDNKVNKTLADESSLLAESENENRVFYLFTRTAREKEEWFNHLLGNLNGFHKKYEVKFRKFQKI